MQIRYMFDNVKSILDFSFLISCIILSHFVFLWGKIYLFSLAHPLLPSICRIKSPVSPYSFLSKRISHISSYPTLRLAVFRISLPCQQHHKIFRAFTYLSNDCPNSPPILPASLLGPYSADSSVHSCRILYSLSGVSYPMTCLPPSSQ